MIKEFKIPNVIRKKIEHCSNLARQHADLSGEIDRWFEQQGFKIEALRDTTYSDMDYTGVDLNILEQEINYNIDNLKEESNDEF